MSKVIATIETKTPEERKRIEKKERIFRKGIERIFDIKIGKCQIGILVEYRDMDGEEHIVKGTSFNYTGGGILVQYSDDNPLGYSKVYIPLSAMKWCARKDLSDKVN